MTTNSRHYFDAEKYIESVAYSRANRAYKRAGQSRADYVYETQKNIGMRLWFDLRHDLPWYEAEIWLRKQFGNERGETAEKSAAKPIVKSELRPGPEMYAKSVIDDYKNIVKKVADYEHGNKSENNRKRILKNALNEAQLFLSVEPDFYRAERHGKWLSQSEFNSMLQSCKEIIAKYAVVSTLETAA